MNKKEEMINTKFVLYGILITAILLSIALIMAIRPAENVRELFTLEEPYNITLIVTTTESATFDTEIPEINLIDPTGTKIDMNTLRYRKGSNFIQYFIPNAMIGTWSMSYNRLESTEIEVTYSVFMANIMIEEFTVALQPNEEGYIPIHFRVSADDEHDFEYILHAIVVDDENDILHEIAITEGVADLNEHTVRYVLLEDITGIANMNDIMLRLSAYNRQGQASMRDTAWFDLRGGLFNQTENVTFNEEEEN